MHIYTKGHARALCIEAHYAPCNMATLARASEPFLLEEFGVYAWYLRGQHMQIRSAVPHCGYCHQERFSGGADILRETIANCVGL